MATPSTNERRLPIARPLWVRLVALTLFTVAAGQLAFVAHPYEHLVIPNVGPQTDHGWPLPAVRVTHDDSADGLLLPERVLHLVHAVVNFGLLPRGLLYDLAVVSLSVCGIWFWYTPWRAFPRPQFSLAEVCILLAFVSTGCVLWFRMWSAGAELWQTSQFVLMANSGSYLVITLVYVGVLNGVLAALMRTRQPQQADDRATQPRAQRG